MIEITRYSIYKTYVSGKKISDSRVVRLGAKGELGLNLLALFVVP